MDADFKARAADAGISPERLAAIARTLGEMAVTLTSK